jgi:hypothetical protein
VLRNSTTQRDVTRVEAVNRWRRVLNPVCEN